MPLKQQVVATRIDTDVRLWALETAQALRGGRLQDVDLQELAEQIEWLYGISNELHLKSAVTSRISSLLLYDHTPELSTSVLSSDERESWRSGAEEFRRMIEDMIEDAPSLKTLLIENLQSLYRDAVECIAPYGLSGLPENCPYTLGEILEGGRARCQ